MLIQCFIYLKHKQLHNVYYKQLPIMSYDN
jgi:hypothetical protein